MTQEPKKLYRVWDGYRQPAELHSVTVVKETAQFYFIDTNNNCAFGYSARVPKNRRVFWTPSDAIAAYRKQATETYEAAVKAYEAAMAGADKLEGELAEGGTK